MPVEFHVERQVSQPCRRSLWPVEVDFLHFRREVMRITQLFERGAPANGQGQIQQGSGEI